MATWRLAALTACLLSLTALSALAAHDYEVNLKNLGPHTHWRAPLAAEDFVCLAQAIYFEARGESPKGRLAVGRVVLNRVESKAYPDTICGVVYQNAERINRCQFSFACDGKPEDVFEQTAWWDALNGARQLVACSAACPDESLFANPVWQSTHFHADYVSPRWASKMANTGQIGRHLFYRDPSVAPFRSELSELSGRLIASVMRIVSMSAAL